MREMIVLYKQILPVNATMKFRTVDLGHEYGIRNIKRFKASALANGMPA
jgi:hypothetical protein